MGSLQAHEVRLNMSIKMQEAQAFQVQGESSIHQGNEHGRSSYRGGRGRGRSRGRGNRSNIQCYRCNIYEHIQANCWYKDEKANYAELEEYEESKLFMAHVETNDDVSSDVWFVDSGCSNHMLGTSGRISKSSSCFC